MAVEIKLFFVAIIFFIFSCVRTLKDNNDISERLLRLEDLLTEMEELVMDTDVKVAEALDKLDDNDEMLEWDFSRLQHSAAKYVRRNTRKSWKEARKQLKHDSTILKEMIQTVENISMDKTLEDKSDLISEDTISSEIMFNQSQGLKNVHLEGVSEPRVMFKATTLTKRQYNSGDTVIFPKTINNFGEGYDSKYGVFITPRDGTYYFTVQLYVYGGKGADVGIFVGEECISWAKMSPRYDSCNNLAAITRLNVGDAVYMKQTSPSWSAEVFKSSELDLWNTFSGVLIR